jgi:hypothetical protein
VNAIEIGFLFLGIGIVVAAVVWRTMVRRRAVSALQWALESFDAADRRAAVAVVSQQGLARFAEVLLAHTRREDDATVLLAIADAVARNQWEPADSPPLVQLRMWAQRYLEEEDEGPGPSPRPGGGSSTA